MTDAERLALAKDARLKLLTGSMAEEVDFGTYRARFTRVDLAKLDGAIAELESKLNGVAARGAIGIVF